MKKKVFSKLLMVALVATVGAFTSCKDYDDDINDLRSKVDGLNTSLTTLINEKVTTVTQQVNALEKQLKDVETAYAQADAALQKELDAVKATGIANSDNIKTLLAEVADLKTAKTSLENAIKELKDGLATANANIKGNSDNIIALLAKDTELEKGITDAKAAAKTAFDEATKALNKANENATSISSLQTKEQGDFDNLQKQITDNLTSVTAEIGKVNTALNDYIKLNDGKVDGLDKKVADQKADITAIQTKLGELEKKDTEILDAIDKAKAAQKEINDAQAKKNEELAKDIRANAAAIKTINETTLPQLKEDLIKHTIPEEVAKQIDAVLEDRLQAFLESDVTDLVEEYYEKGVTIMQALDAKVDSIDEAINTTMTLEFLLVAAAIDSIADAHDTKAGEIVTAYKAADTKLWEGIDSIGDLLETAKTTLGNRITTLDEQINGKGEAKGIVGQISALESWFAPAAAAEGEEASGLLKYQEELLKSEAVIAKVNELVAAANGEINSMITSINLFAGPHNYAHGNQDGTGYYEFDHDLNFTYAIEYGTVFPEPAMQKYVNDSIKFTKGYLRTYADSILVRVSPVNAVLDKDFIALINSQGEDIVASGIVCADSVKRYSRPAGQYLTRATNDGETGLWVIYFSLKDEDPTVWQKFKAAAYPKDDEGKYVENRQILYSVGVKNTKKDDAEDNRYVVSEYDLGLGTSKAYHAWDYNVVNGLKVTNVQNIHNRYIVNENKPNSTTAAKLWTDDQERYPESYNEELTYAPFDPYYKFAGKDSYPDGVNNQCGNIGSYVKKNNETVLDIFGEKVVYDYPGYIYQDLKKQKTADDEALTFNVTDRWGYTIDHRVNQTYYGRQGIDNRDWAKILTVNFNGDWAEINIKFPRFIYCANQDGYRSTEIGGFFVMLDQNFARESSTSEVSAWTQYIYEGVGFRSVNGFNTVTGQYIYDETRNDEQAGIVNGIRKATLFKGNEGTIKIKNARGAKGDVIGFRVYAVNLDGTLYDPDGRAFYVKVGDATEERTLNFDVTVYQEAGDTATQAEDIVAFNKAADKAKTNQFFNMTQIELNKGSKYSFKWSWTEKDAQGNKVVSDVVRDDEYNDYIYTPKEGEDEYLNDLFRFWYTDAETVNKDTKWTAKMNAYGSETDFYGKVPVNNVAVELLNADRLLDNGIYHLKLEIFKEDPDGAKSQVNTIFVNVKKTMPNRPPKAFMLRDVQDKVITIYMRPKGEDQTDIWGIWNWFRADEKVLASANYKNYGFDLFYKQDGKTIIEHLDEVYPREKSRMTRGSDSNNDRDYVWATDVRPFNFEEIFHGLIINPAGAAVNNTPQDNQDAYLAQFDQNYSFYFPGVGSYKKWYDDVDAKVRYEAVKDTAVTYFRSDEKMIPKNLIYRGLDTDKENIVEQKWPGYYLPYIYYENVKEDGKGVELPVMVAYTYRNISFKKNVGLDGRTYYTHGDFTTKPTYFKADGSATDKAGSEFKVKFECAIDPKFEITTMKDSVQSLNANDEIALGINGTAINGTKKTHNLDKAINYGNTFLVSFDSLTVAWKSNKAALENNKNTGASYFRTNFAEFAQNVNAGKFPETAVAYHQDTCWIWSQNNDHFFYGHNILVDKNGVIAPHVAIVGADVQPAISDIELYIYKTKDTEGNGEKADINHYFDVKTFASEQDGGVGSQERRFGGEAFGKYGLLFISKSTSLDPTKIHRMRIVVKTAKTTLVHQWGHSTAGKQSERTIWIKNPASTPEIQGARRTR